MYVAQTLVLTNRPFIFCIQLLAEGVEKIVLSLGSSLAKTSQCFLIIFEMDGRLGWNFLICNILIIVHFSFPGMCSSLCLLHFHGSYGSSWNVFHSSEQLSPDSSSQAMRRIR